ncbi:hypothetical protein SAMN04488515_3275 [Cognatiyoonia koreensis]|uniref:Ferrochelatase n=1 Tax=Cognatiyoonia koreensis TaxID=364200 RepID=A0A1I0RUJ6_9RHOB|nr:hypothetical protein [Cognatiyoonia koreensis]SEW45026.1 hypothetical protein SAMN04488515_3275 [Cognatiyoonia koreensis]
MRFTKTLVVAAAIAVSGSSAFAGGLAPVQTEAAPIAPIVVEPVAAGSSIPAGYIVLGLLAALVAASGSF